VQFHREAIAPTPPQHEEFYSRNEMQDIFNKFDTDHSGEIDAKELGEALSAFGINHTKKQLAKLMAMFDVDGNGTVSFNEFLFFFAGQKKSMSLRGLMRKSMGSFAPPSHDNSTSSAFAPPSPDTSNRSTLQHLWHRPSTPEISQGLSASDVRRRPSEAIRRGMLGSFEAEHIDVLLADSGVRWISPEYIVALARHCEKTGEPYPRCQDLPKEAFVRPVRRPYAVSHAWLSSEHPDPNGLHMKILAKKVQHNGLKADDAIFLDFLSMPQKDKYGFRTEKDTETFKKALKSLNDVYALCHGIIIHQIPSSDPSIVPYLERGWCFFEVSVALITGRLVDDSEFTRHMKETFQPALVEMMESKNMDAFMKWWRGHLEKKAFTCRAEDLDRVTNLFRFVVKNHSRIHGLYTNATNCIEAGTGDNPQLEDKMDTRSTGSGSSRHSSFSESDEDLNSTFTSSCLSETKEDLNSSFTRTFTRSAMIY